VLNIGGITTPVAFANKAALNDLSHLRNASKFGER